MLTVPEFRKLNLGNLSYKRNAYCVAFNVYLQL